VSNEQMSREQARPARPAGRRRALSFRSPVWLLAALALLIVATGCASIAKPEGWAAPTSEGDTLYVSLDRGEISAVDPEDFTEKWKFPEDDEFACANESNQKKRDLEGIYGEPAVDPGNGLLYFGAYDGAVYALNAEDGACAWRSETDDRILTRVQLVGDKLYAPSTDGHLYVLDAATGDELDSFDAGAELWASPLIEDASIFVATMKGTLYKLDLETLAPEWDAPFDVRGGLLMDPIMLDDATVLIGGIGEKLYAVNAEDGTEKWSAGGENWFWGKPAVDGGTLYAPNMDGHVYAIDAETGETLWSYDTGAPVRAGTLVIDGAAVAVNRSGEVHGLDANADAPTLLWGAPADIDKRVHSDPIEFSGAILVLSTSGDLFQIDTEAGRLTSLDVDR